MTGDSERSEQMTNHNKTARGKPANDRAATLPSGRRWLFTAIMLLIPVLFFGLLEGVLRLTGYGDDYPLFVPVETHPEYQYLSRDVARRYFSEGMAAPSGLLDFFLTRKDSSTFRIVVQGGSSAAGYPFYYGGAFSRMLEQRLLQTFPGRRIEVVNTAMAAVNSHTLLDFVDEILEQQPDAVLMYAGHNEYYGALGVGSSESFGPSYWLTRWYVQLRRWRTVQAVREVLAGAAQLFSGSGRGEPPSATLMERMVGEQRIPYGSALFEQGLEQFRRNLAAILARYQAHGVPVFVGTLASNERDHAPFISSHAPAAAWRAQRDRVRAALAAGDTTAALSGVEALIQLDSLSADAFYLKGQILEGQTRYKAARTAYLAAKDRDELRFRAPETMNRIIREEAARYGAVVVETQAALAGASPGGIIGTNLMLEHLHPNVNGYLRIADAFYDALRREHLIGSWEHSISFEKARTEVLLTPVDSLVGIFRIRKLMASWPFQPPGVFDRSLDTLTASNPVEQIALDLYHERVSWREANDALRRYYEAQGDYHRALQATLVHVQEYPLLAQPYLVAGNILIRQGRYAEALTYLEASNDLEESAQAQRMIGSVLLQQGKRQEAIEHLERAIVLEPDNVPALYNLSGAYALTGQIAKARETVHRLLTLAPDHRDGQRLLASLPSANP